MTSCALLLRTEVDLGTSRDPALEAAFHRVLLIYPLHLHHHPAGALGRVVDASGRRKLAKVVEHPHAQHAVFRAVRVFCAPATCVVLETEHDVAWG